MGTKAGMKEVIMYQASIKLDGKWITTQVTPTLDETMDNVARERKKCTSTYMPCNIIEVRRYVPAP